MPAFIIFVLLILSSAVVYAEYELHRGENLLQPMPVPGEDWQVSSRSDDQTRSVRWSHPTTNESLTANIMSGGSRSVARFREINDNTGKSQCSNFSSRTIDEAKTNGYQRAIWLSDCGLKNSEGFSVLHHFIAGRDSSYYLTKRWPGSPDQESLDEWVRYFESISCSSRDPI